MADRGALLPAATLSALLLSFPSPSPAQVYTKVNANGVVEATNVPDSSGFRLTYPGKGTLIHSRSFRSTRYTGQFDRHIEEACQLHQVSTDLVKAVIAAESEFDQYAVSSKGARGLMQLMPPTARRFGVSDAFDARQNIFAGTQYLRILLDQFQQRRRARAGRLQRRRERGAALRGRAALQGDARLRGEDPAHARRLRRGPRGVGANEQLHRSSPRPGRCAPALLPPAAQPRSRRVEPARPATYYRWRDARGVPHVAESPPPEGTVYQTVRALD